MVCATPHKLILKLPSIIYLVGFKYYIDFLFLHCLSLVYMWSSKYLSVGKVLLYFAGWWHSMDNGLIS